MVWNYYTCFWSLLSLQRGKGECFLPYLIFLGFCIRNLGKKNPVLWGEGRVIAHPGICPPCGVWGCDGILSIPRPSSPVASCHTDWATRPTYDTGMPYHSYEMSYPNVSNTRAKECVTPLNEWRDSKLWSRTLQAVHNVTVFAPKF
jgi:hypothetical protein